MLAGHRELPGAALFSRLNELEIGDTFSIYTVKGLHTYKVISIDTIFRWFEMETFRNQTRISTTLVTCTPYMINSHRLLVTGTRVEEKRKCRYTEALVYTLDSIGKYWSFIGGRLDIVSENRMSKKVKPCIIGTKEIAYEIVCFGF